MKGGEIRLDKIKIDEWKDFFSEIDSNWFLKKIISGDLLKSNKAELQKEVDLRAQLSEPTQKIPYKDYTVGDLCCGFRASHHFNSLDKRTRSDYLTELKKIEKISHIAVSRLDTPTMNRILQDHATDRSWNESNKLRTAYSELFKWGVVNGVVKENYVACIKRLKRPKDMPDANPLWTNEEFNRVLAILPPYMRIAIQLMAYTALDPCDAITLQKDQLFLYKDQYCLETKRSKTGASVNIPVIDPLKEALDNAPQHNSLTVLVNGKGKPFTYSGLASVWGRAKQKLVKGGLIRKGLTLKGLRHTIATTLKENNAPDTAIMNFLGQKSISSTMTYVNKANLLDSNIQTGRQHLKPTSKNELSNRLNTSV